MSDSAFVAFGAAVSWIEIVAFVLALGCVACNIREIHWGWPLAIVSSLLYGILFADHGLYGEAWLQAFFAVIAAWGWWQWLYGARPANGAPDAAAERPALAIATLGRRRFAAALLGWGIGWLALGAALAQLTDSELPYQDAFPTAGSVLGQILLGRKFVENWLVWLVVNVASVVLFATRGLWLTVLLYLVFVAMSWVGLRAWRARLGPGAPAAGHADTAR